MYNDPEPLSLPFSFTFSMFKWSDHCVVKEVLEVDDDSMSTGGSASESTSTVTSWLALLGSEGLTRTDCCCEGECVLNGVVYIESGCQKSFVGTVRIPFS
jgi:hypothetical protein